jgi:Cyclin, C-terminal domain/Cyclin, N-terminal domain
MHKYSFDVSFAHAVLFCSACIWMASKMEDRTPPDIRDLEYISDYSVTPSQMRALEEKICSALSFRLHRVTPFQYVQVYLRASEQGRDPMTSSPLRSMTLYLLELSRYSFRISDQPASVIAAACVYLARATLGIQDFSHCADTGQYWTKTLEYYTGYKMDDLKVIVLCLHSLQISAESSSIGVAPAYGNYRTEAHFRVSARTVRRVEDLGFSTNFFHDSLTTNPTTRAVQIPAFHL